MTSRNEVAISAAADQVITAWVWRPGSEIASAHGRFSVVPLPGIWWRVTLDLGIVWDEIVCRVEQETPTVDLPANLERCLEILERSWVRDAEARAHRVDGLLEELRLPPEFAAGLRRFLVEGMTPALDETAGRRAGGRLWQHGVRHTVVAGELRGMAEPDLRWPGPPHFTNAAWQANPGEIWAAVATYGSVVLTDEDGAINGAISRPMGALDESPGSP
mgnify:FL=1